METFNIAGKIQTVSGLIEPSRLGMTLTHEHMLIDLSSVHGPPLDPEEKAIYYSELNEKTLGMIRHHHVSNAQNYRLTNIGTAVDEVTLYKNHGGGTLVDATSEGIGRDPKGLLEISTSTGVNIIMGSGFYVQSSHPTFVKEETSRELSERIIEDIVAGASGSTVKSGIIGEIGCSWPLTANERKVLRAAATAQLETGAPILIHPGRAPGAPSEILDILSNANADITRTVIGHLDRTYTDTKDLLDLASSGCYLEYDLFGIEVSYFPLAEVDMASDAQRLDFIQFLVDAGYQNRIVIAQDICRKERLVKYGGYGYAHILENIVPWLIDRGLSPDQIDGITTRNPAELLSFI